MTGGLVYAGVLLGLWIVLAGQPDTQDLVAGSVAAVLAVGFGYLLSERGKMVPSVRAADLRTLAAVPWRVVAETGQVFALAARKASGRPVAPGALRTVPLDTGPDVRRMAGRATGSGADRAAVRGAEHGRGGHRHGSRHGAGAPAGRCPPGRCTPGRRTPGAAGMSWFLAAALVLQVALVPCAWVCWRFDSEHRVVALGLAGTVQALAVLCLAVGYGEPGLASLAVVLAALSSGGSVAFARFLERWL